MTPIFKGGDKNSFGNYRPISVISVIGKVMEKVVYDQVHEYLLEHNLLTSCQSGFRPKHSTQSALLNVTDKWMSAIDNGELVGLVMIDLKKAFDCVDHSILLKKLALYGFDTAVVKWFENYLCSERKQYTCINGMSSDVRNVKCGVPQGSLLGPVLFSLYTNDLPNKVNNCQMSLYADDTCLFCSGSDPKQIIDTLNDDLKEISVWLKENKLVVNAKKCETMIIGTKPKLKKCNNHFNEYPVYIDSTVVKRVSTCKYLGIYIDENLLWNKQIEHLKSKVVKSLYLLKRIRPYIDERIALLFYKSVIQSHFDYCCVVWGNTCRTYCKQLQILQNRSLRIVMKVDYLFSTNQLYASLHLDKLHTRRTKQLAKIMYQSEKRMGPPYLSELFIRRESHYQTRSGEAQLELIRPKTNYGKRRFIYQGAKLWNSLVNRISSQTSLAVFKKCLNRLIV